MPLSTNLANLSHLSMLFKLSSTRPIGLINRTIFYTSQRLYNIRRAKPRTRLTNEAYQNIQSLGLLRTRGCRGGKLKQRTIPCLETINRLSQKQPKPTNRNLRLISSQHTSAENRIGNCLYSSPHYTHSPPRIYTECCFVG